jgi:hypothetical protein
VHQRILEIFCDERRKWTLSSGRRTSEGGDAVYPRMVCTGCGIIGADARPDWKEQPLRGSLDRVQWR